jgi:cyanophycin synthetase
LVSGESDSIEAILRQLQRRSLDSDLGPSTRAIWNEARRRQIPVRRLGEDSLLQLGYGKYMRFIEASLPDSTSSIAVDLAKINIITHQALQFYSQVFGNVGHQGSFLQALYKTSWVTR